MSRTNDIVTRLTLRGEQFTSGLDKAMSGLRSSVASANADVRRDFNATSKLIEDIGKRAAAAPRTASGSLNIDAAGARMAAQAAEAEAVALREVAQAAERVAKQKGVLAERDSAYIMGARAAADAAEAHARAMGHQAHFADMLQAELNQTASATDAVIAKNRQLNAATGASGQRSVQASQQFQDFFIQVQGGGNIAVAASQQLSQLAFVMQGAGGIAGRAAAILSGPWGAAIFGGVTLLGMFIPKLIESGNAIEDEGKKLADNEQKTRQMEAAKAAYAKTIPAIIDTIKKQTAALDQQNRTFEENIRLARQAAQQQIATLTGARDDTALNLLQAKQQLADARDALQRQERAAQRPTQAGEMAALGIAGKQSEVDRLEARVQKLQGIANQIAESITGAERQIEGTVVDQARRSAQHALDPLVRIRDTYADLRVEAERTIKVKEKLTARLVEIGRQEQQAIKREQERQRLDRDGGSAHEQRVGISVPFGSDRISSGYGRRKPPKDGASENHAGIDYAVPVGTIVRAGASGVVVRTGTMRGYGNVVVIDYGDKLEATYGHLSKALVKPGQVVRAGERVALTGNTGTSTGPHLHYEVRKGGRPIDPRHASAREGAGDKAAADAARELDNLRKKEAEQRDRIMMASQRQLDVDVESLRFMGMKVRGLDEQMAAEMDIARIEREHADRMAELTPAQRKEQQEINTDLLSAAIVLRSQADIYAKLREEAGDLTNLTEDQRQALDDANRSMLAQLETARALAETAAEQKTLDIEIARARARIATSEGKGNDRGRADKQAAEKAANDNEKTMRERAESERDRIMSLADLYRDAFQNGTGSIVENFKDEMLDVISELTARWTIALLTTGKTPSMGNILSDMGAQSGVGGGGLLGGLLSALGGKKSANAHGAGGLVDITHAGAGAAKAGGLLGGLGGIGGAISSALPYAAIAAAVLPMVMGLFTSPKWGSASLYLNKGIVSGGEGVGKGASQIKAAAGGAGSVAEGINRLAEQLGATISGIPGVTIGTWDGKARVALTNTSDPLHAKSAAGKAGLIKDFGEGGEQEAIQYAIQYAFTNAALDGISQASKNIIKAGGDDVASAITKALLIEDVPKRLQAILDPVGYAVDTFNKSWEKTIAAMKEGGASAEEMANAQKLYKLELDQTKASAREASADFKSFLAGLNYGSASPYSTRDQERMAADAFKPFEEAILRGERVDQGKFTEAAQTWLDLQRELFGSTGAFFDAMGKVQNLTSKAISDIDNAKPIRVESDPWVKAGATAQQASADMLELVTQQNAETNRILAQIRAAMGGSGASFMNENRLFAA
ncbi:peptidoglycan DD-metalloendopeptidase family protein [Sphingomonas sp. MG17]|uniref:Peptidoglycan DD-metalloendopeptidase family protein n=1 Tax=Sphingomonas tagetis TaxID=2949092 RepID=A0A9X2HGE3_9SPHN|nr:peptidoglycan DD-metalloendopeptidase family protein [Sphingomonas tagetis]MCP3730651.1 peptidoglycan DD-metalloendopeptidase family protein [Sphingomonas tagetis]